MRPRSHQFIALQILEKLIQTRWKTLPADQQGGIRNFIVQVTVDVSSDETRMRREKSYLNKLNLVLVQVRFVLPRAG
jgi:exportin-1